MKIVEVMCHNASLRLIELTCEVSYLTAFLWRHKVFATVSGWQGEVALPGRVWIDERYKANAAGSVHLEQMEHVNRPCSWIRRYVERFACMKSDNLQAYLDWFIYLHRVRRDAEGWRVEERIVRHLVLSDGVYLRKW